MSGIDDTVRVLHVDDEPSLSDMVATFLEREDAQITVRTATNTDEGLEILSTDNIDCIVSDYDMPGRNGIEFLKTVREDHPDLPFILYTGKGSEEVASDAISAGVTDYLQKESGTDQYTILANRITNAVSQTRAVQEVTRTRSYYKERERRLEQYEKIVETMDDVAFVVNDEWTVEFANESILEYVDGPLDALEGHQVMRLAEEYLAEEDDPARFKQALERTFEHECTSGSPELLELTLDTDDEQVTFEYQFSPLVADGETSAVVITMRDITKRKRQEERFQAFIEHSTDIISVLDPDGTYHYQSPSSERITGYESEELLGETAFEYVHPDDRHNVMESFSEAVANPEMTPTVEYRFKHEDGSWRWFESIGNNQLANPAIDGFVVNSRDITERKQRVQEIQRLKERLELAVQGANLGVWDWDMTTDDVEFNDQWAEMLGYTLEELEPHLRTWETRVHPDDSEEVKAALDAHIQQETDYYDTEHRMRTADGDWKWIRDLGKIVERDSDGEPIRAVGIHLDIDESKQYQHELEQKTERLDEFASIVSHDLRNPLAVAAGNLELVRDDCESPHLESIERAHGRMRALIEDLLTLAREGEAVTDTDAVNLATVVRECWEGVETAESSLTIENDRAVEADKSRLKQLLENLFRNAIEHGGEEVTVTVGVLEDGFYIEDDGPGVPVAERDEVFEAGFTSNPDGTGFGLSIVKRVVEAHNWEIEVVEGIDGGARFEITGVEMTER